MADSLEYQPAVEVDENASLETDSAYNGSVGSASYLSSLSSGIKDYKYENGRRYHSFREGSYLVPNDEKEQDRMDFLHHIYGLILDGKLQKAPIDQNIQRVLDIGTGTGIWAIEFADEYPSAHVIGTDLSPIQPTWVPPNCQFEIDDYESPWLFRTPFDYIHARELEGCIADEDKLFREAFQHLKPGGYFEIEGSSSHLSSDDGTHEKAEYNQLWFKEGRNSAKSFGKLADNAPTWKAKLEKAGFVDVKEFVFKLPFGPWPKDPKLKEIGRYQQVQQVQAIESYTPGFLTRIGGWEPEEAQVLIAKVRKELSDSSLHMYVPIYFVWGRKPL
ncbi:hypothetical protein MAP00_003532 [Monascus purpureus]|nr:hypothetical protein MAP00_003532 [Monascus purpureus]